MVVAVCFIHVFPGKGKSAKKRLVSLRGARKVMELFGEYDFLLILEGEDLKEINTRVDEVRLFEEVQRTKTIIGADI
jgi:DNA-binding Lrp family transcriptional regulator